MYGVIYGRPEGERSHPHELQYIAAVAVNGPGGQARLEVARGERIPPVMWFGVTYALR